MRVPVGKEAAMRRFLTSIVCVALVGVGCGSDNGTRIPTGPSPAPAPAPPPFSFAEPYTQITIGEVVNRLVTADNPPCVGWPQWQCQYFRVTAPSDGTFEAVMKSSLGTATGVLDLTFTNSEGREWWYPVSVPIRAGATYQIALWYASPGIEFELRTSLK
jgi:hypothetical protein